LQAEAVEVVVSDGCLGLPKAMKRALPQAQQQRCITVRLSALRLELRSKAHVEAHKVRGLDRYLSYQHLAETNEPRDKLKPEKAKRQRRFEMQSDAYKIFKAETEAQAGSPVSTVRTVLNCQRQNEGFSLFNGANANGRMRVSASVPKTVRSIAVCLVENGGDADSFSSFIVLKASNSKDFTIHQVCLSPEVQESPQAQQDYGSLSRNGKHWNPKPLRSFNKISS